VLSVEDWAEIRRLYRAEGMPIKQVARVMGCSKNTVKRALAAAGPPRYQRRVGGGSIVDGVEPRIRELLAAWPTMPATVIAERIGWTRSLTVLKDRVRELRPVYLPPDPASRTAYAAGEVAQCDLWFPAITLPVGFGQTRTASRLPVLVMVTGYARWLAARLLPSRAAEDLFAGWWQLLQGLGGVPRVLVWDGEGAVGQRRRRQTVLTEAAHAFRGVLGARILICNPADPEAKGLVERANGYLETSFLPGRVFASPADFNAQLADWLALVNQRRRRVLGCAPADRIEADRAAMLRLPPVAPVTGWRTSLRLPRDHYVRLDSNDYSVHPSAVGRRVEVAADLDQVRVWCDGRLVADHGRCWARHQTLSDPAHLAAAAQLRHQRAVLGATNAGRDTEDVQLRRLTDYDAAFGLDDSQGVA
jgi:transposase